MDNFDHLQRRELSTVKAQLIPSPPGPRWCLMAPSDLGVQLNGGRRGAAHGPEAIVHQFSRRQSPPRPIVVQDLLEHWPGGDLAQQQEFHTRALGELFHRWGVPPKLVHLGGGHDQIFPLLQALPKGRVRLINFDAHLDTRDDPRPHSGTPLRQWMRQAPPGASVVQIGIGPWANPKENFQGPELQNMEVITIDELLKWNPPHVPRAIQRAMFGDWDFDTLVVSLDCDGLDASEFPAVSAPNPLGMSFGQFRSMMELAHQVRVPRKVLGIYEYNPLFDDLGASCGRKLGQIIDDFFGEKG